MLEMTLDDAAAEAILLRASIASAEGDQPEAIDQLLSAVVLLPSSKLLSDALAHHIRLAGEDPEEIAQRLPIWRQHQSATISILAPRKSMQPDIHADPLPNTLLKSRPSPDAAREVHGDRPSGVESLEQAAALHLPSAKITTEPAPGPPTEWRGFFQQFAQKFSLEHLNRDHFTKLSAVERSNVENQMRMFLSRPRTEDEMFPDSHLVFGYGRDYHHVRTDEINYVFPNVDHDIRELLDTFRAMFWRNFLTKVALRRLSQLVSTLLVFVGAYLLASNVHAMPIVADVVNAFPGVAPFAFGFDVSLLISLGTALVSYGLSYLVVTRSVFLLTNRWIEDSFQPAVQNSCVVISQNILERLAGLSNCLNEISVAIRDLYDQSEAKWTKEADYLMGLLVWIPLRSLHIESYFQLVMWNVRRHIFFIQWCGAALAAFIVTATLFVLWLLFGKYFVGGHAGLLVFSLLAVYLAVQSFFGRQTGMIFLRSLFAIERWQTFEQIGMHRSIEGVVRFLIKKFIMLRDVGKAGKI